MKVTVRQKSISSSSKMRLYLDSYRSKNERYKEKLELWSLMLSIQTLRRKTNLITANYAENNLYIYRINQNQDGSLHSSA